MSHVAERAEHVMRVMSPREGDFRLHWDPADAESVANAKQAFADLRRKGFRAYRIERAKGQRRGTEIVAFDATAAELLVVPAMAGGCA
jgi:hypothetical protein